MLLTILKLVTIVINYNCMFGKFKSRTQAFLNVLHVAVFENVNWSNGNGSPHLSSTRAELYLSVHTNIFYPLWTKTTGITHDYIQTPPCLLGL